MKRIIKVLICCILAVSMLTPMTALAASRLATPTGFKVVTTTTSSVRVKWTKVKGAAKYTVQYSTNKKFKKAKKVTVSANKATVKKLAAKKFTTSAFVLPKKAEKPVLIQRPLRLKLFLMLIKNSKALGLTANFIWVLTV